MEQSAFDKFVTASINFIVAPPSTPRAIRQRLGQAIAHALPGTPVKKAFAKIGAKEQPASPGELSSYLAQPQVRWSKIVATTRISVE